MPILGFKAPFNSNEPCTCGQPKVAPLCYCGSSDAYCVSSQGTSPYFAQSDDPRLNKLWAPTTANYLTGSAQGGLSAEIVVGTTPGGELGGTWASPTVDTVHSGSSHASMGGATGPTPAGGHDGRHWGNWCDWWDWADRSYRLRHRFGWDRCNRRHRTDWCDRGDWCDWGNRQRWWWQRHSVRYVIPR